MKKVVLKVELHDEKAKQKAMKAVSSLPGINSIIVELKEKKMTVVGDIDPVEVVEKLRNNWYAEILTVGPPKKVEEKETKEKTPLNYYCYNRYPTYYYVQTEDEYPNTCVLC